MINNESLTFDRGLLALHIEAILIQVNLGNNLLNTSKMEDCAY